MPTMDDLVKKTRGMLFGGMGDTLARTATQYNPGDTTFNLQDRVQIGAGSLISCDLNTFYVSGVTADGTTMKIIAGADGGPDMPCAANSIARIKPKATNWSIFRELVDAIVDLASPRSGIFWADSFQLPVNFVEGLYPLPPTWWEAQNFPLKMLKVRAKRSGIDDWLDVGGALWLPERFAVRVPYIPEDCLVLEFTFAWPFLTPAELTDDLFDLGLTERSTQDLPPLRAAGMLALGVEGRRAQPYSQGDTRRPEEVPTTTSLGVERDFLREYRERVMAEQSRLQALWTPRFVMGGRS